MDQNKHEMGKWDENPKEPREPLLPDEMLYSSGGEVETPRVEGLHMPKKPLTIDGLKSFLIELKPLVEHINFLRRNDQHKIISYLQEVRKEICLESFSNEQIFAFEKVTFHFSELLMHSNPFDVRAVLKDIEILEATL